MTLNKTNLEKMPQNLTISKNNLNRTPSNARTIIKINKKKNVKDLINIDQEYKGLKYRLTDLPIFVHEEKQTSDKRLIRAQFVGNPEKLNSILRITEKKEQSATPFVKPWSEIELLWSDHKPFAKLEKQKTLKSKQPIECEG